VYTKAFLSIDLDYWADHRSERSSLLFFNKVADLYLPIHVVESHEEMLPLINESGCSVLYNVDYHSDIFGFDNPEERESWIEEHPHPNEGQWGPYVEWRDKGCFWWMYPWKRCYGDAGCTWGGDGSCWDRSRCNPFTKGYTQWAKTRRCKGTTPIRWGTISKVAVCLSPDWYDRKTVWRAMRALGLDWVVSNSDSFCGHVIKGFKSRWQKAKKVC